jgi:hypothetical protein
MAASSMVVGVGEAIHSGKLRIVVFFGRNLPSPVGYLFGGESIAVSVKVATKCPIDKITIPI